MLQFCIIMSSQLLPRRPCTSIQLTQLVKQYLHMIGKAKLRKNPPQLPSRYLSPSPYSERLGILQRFPSRVTPISIARAHKNVAMSVQPIQDNKVSDEKPVQDNEGLWVWVKVYIPFPRGRQLLSGVDLSQASSA